MPIKKENRARYPANWPAIRAAVLERAGNRCEWCGASNHQWLIRDGRTSEPLGSFPTREEAAQERAALLVAMVYALPPVRIVLTCAHLDHTPENCALDNLRALCQRCHLRYDAEFHARNAAETLARNREQLCLEDRAAREAAGQRSLF